MLQAYINLSHVLLCGAGDIAKLRFIALCVSFRWWTLQEFTATSTQKGDSLETVVKAAYGNKNYKFASSILPDGKVGWHTFAADMAATRVAKYLCHNFVPSAGLAEHHC